VRADESRKTRGHIALGASTWVWVLSLCGFSLGGCGDYDPETRGAGGTTSTSGQPSTPANGGGNGTSSNVTPVDAPCTNQAACGGEIAGTWAVAGSCLPVSGMVDMAGFGLGCTAAPVTGTLQVSGSWEAKADGTFADQTTTSGEAEIALPAACLNVSGTVTMCDRVDGALQALGYASVTCANAANGGCTCTGSVQQMGSFGFVTDESARSGTYSTANNVVTTSAARTQTQYEYCVSGSTLTMTPQLAGRTGAVMGTVVLQKQ
jgi:hypothetical protein